MSVTIGNITQRIKSNKQNIKINLTVNPEFEQQNKIKPSYFISFNFNELCGK